MPLPEQAQCLMQPGVLSGGNLVYCAPTSGGKSAVAEILMLRRLITTGRTAMLVMPFVTLCAEKSAHLERLLKPLEKYVFVAAVYAAALQRHLFVLFGRVTCSSLLSMLLLCKDICLYWTLAVHACWACLSFGGQL